MSGAEEATVPLRWQGRELAARPGQTVAAALLENGVRSWRRTRDGGRPRGLFCGIGACYDCLVRLDGGPDVRACLVPVTRGLRVDPGGPAPEQDSTERDTTVQDTTVRDPAAQDPADEDATVQECTARSRSVQDPAGPVRTVQDRTEEDV